MPPLLLEFAAQYAGFTRTTIARWQENPDLRASENVTLMDALAGASPDYSLIALKPGDADRSQALETVFSKKFGVALSDLAQRFERRLQKTESLREQVDGLQLDVSRLTEIIEDTRRIASRTLLEKYFFVRMGGRCRPFVGCSSTIPESREACFAHWCSTRTAGRDAPSRLDDEQGISRLAAAGPIPVGRRRAATGGGRAERTGTLFPDAATRREIAGSEKSPVEKARLFCAF